MYCDSCGSFIPDDQSFCSNCGAPAYRSESSPAPQPAVQSAAEPIEQPVTQQPVTQPVEQQSYAQQQAYQQPAAQPVQPAYTQPAAVAAAVPAKRSNPLAIVGLIIGILALVFCWVPFVNWILALFGLGFSIAGIAKKNASGKDMGITGLILSLLGAIIGTAMILILTVGVNKYVEQAESAAATADFGDDSIQSLEDELGFDFDDFDFDEHDFYFGTDDDNIDSDSDT